MREIKFRAYHHGGGDPRVKGEIRYSSTSLRMFFENVENEDLAVELMQYTGLKDKNGVEIYEGDIVKKLIGNYKLGKVVFEFGMFCFQSIGCGIYAGSDAFLHIHSLHYKEYNSNKNYEVIGNIYENPELLESK